MWHRASRCECASPWNSIPMKSPVKRRSPASPMWMSCMIVIWCRTGLGLSGPAWVSRGHEQETVRPVRTSRAAAATRPGVIRFSATFSSSGPQRLQFLHDSYMRANSPADTAGDAGLAPVIRFAAFLVRSAVRVQFRGGYPGELPGVEQIALGERGFLRRREHPLALVVAGVRGTLDPGGLERLGDVVQPAAFPEHDARALLADQGGRVGQRLGDVGAADVADPGRDDAG